MELTQKDLKKRNKNLIYECIKKIYRQIKGKER